MTFMQVAAFLLHIGAALLMGVAIGMERQFRQHPAGLRTNALVCVGAALFVSLSGNVSNDTTATCRMAAYVVSGIGFLGGGVILKMSEQHQIVGITTAAGIWLTATIGIAAGTGRLGLAVVGTVLAFVILTFFFRFDHNIPKSGPSDLS